MQSRIRTHRSPYVITVALLVAAFGITSCSLENQAPPPLTGPSEFALSVALSATPDQLPRDGQSQSTVTAVVRDAQSRPVSGQRLGLGVSGPSGSLISQAEVTTNADGRATFTVTAPPQSAVGSSMLVVTAVPVGTNFDNAAGRSVSIALAGIANTTAPTPAFTYLPAAPETNQVVTFDASTTKDEGVACGTNCTYAWNFDDGSIGTGMTVSHRFTAPRRYGVTLTVTDLAGLTSDFVSSVTVAGVNAPTVTVTNSPEPVLVNQRAAFTAIATTPSGHSIQRYEWDFGDGTTQVTTSGSVFKTYSTVGKYVVTVSAIDDLGQTGSAAKTVTVTFAVDPPVANFVSAPSAPKVNDTVTFNGSTSTVGTGATIVSYNWDFGQGAAPVNTGTTPAAQTVYAVQGTYIVTLTVTDSLGRVATRTATITVTP